MIVLKKVDLKNKIDSRNYGKLLDIYKDEKAAVFEAYFLFYKFIFSFSIVWLGFSPIL